MLLKSQELIQVSLYPWNNLPTNHVTGIEGTKKMSFQFNHNTKTPPKLITLWPSEDKNSLSLSLCFTSLQWTPQISKPGY